MNPESIPTSDSGVTCDGCGWPMPATERGPLDAREPCPHCGSLLRASVVSAADSLPALRSSLGLKLRRAGSRRVVQQQFVGASRSADGSWVEKATLQDHESGRYLEHLVGPHGTVIHHDEGPLSEHKGHGSDKPELRTAREGAKQARTEADRVRADQLTWRRGRGYALAHDSQSVPPAATKASRTTVTMSLPTARASYALSLAICPVLRA